jgi:hypothetical protein
MAWAKPQRCPQTWDKALWGELPEELAMRIVRCTASPQNESCNAPDITNVADTAPTRNHSRGS